MRYQKTTSSGARDSQIGWQWKRPNHCLRSAQSTSKRQLLWPFTGPDQLQELLLSSDIYVHTAYIDNSPNSVCEAQYLGVPIVATNVGGIPSLVIDGEEGKLVPANSCYNMAYEIISLSHDKARQKKYSSNSRKHAMERHNPKHILLELVECYRAVIDNNLIYQL